MSRDGATAIRPPAIRLACAADADAISRLIHSLSEQLTIHPDGRGAELFFGTITPSAIVQHIGAMRYLIAQVDGQLAGVMALRDNCHIYHLFVDPRFQGRGVASAMWADLKAHALAHGNPGRFTVNASLGAMPVYSAFGFTAADERKEDHGLIYVPMASV